MLSGQHADKILTRKINHRGTGAQSVTSYEDRNNYFSSFSVSLCLRGENGPGSGFSGSLEKEKRTGGAPCHSSWK
jgi:hypothetical protein